MKTINAKQLRNGLPGIVEQVRKGQEYLVIYRSEPAFRLVPARGSLAPSTPDEDPLYRASALGRSGSAITSREIDAVVYGIRRR